MPRVNNYGKLDWRLLDQAQRVLNRACKKVLGFNLEDDAVGFSHMEHGSYLLTFKLELEHHVCLRIDEFTIFWPQGMAEPCTGMTGEEDYINLPVTQCTIPKPLQYALWQLAVAYDAKVACMYQGNVIEIEIDPFREEVRNPTQLVESFARKLTKWTLENWNGDIPESYGSLSSPAKLDAS